MIQRIQTLYLLLTTLLSGLFLSGNILSFIDKSGARFFLKFSGFYSTSADKTETLIRHLIPFTATGILILFCSVVAIFLFRKRNLQLKFSLVLIALLVALILILTAYSVYFNKQFNVLPETGFKTILPLLSLFTAIMAYKGIRKDINLVDSIDRLR